MAGTAHTSDGDQLHGSRAAPDGQALFPGWAPKGKSTPARLIESVRKFFG
ncbi:hypothetical protein [Amycolatopsis sp. Hca4]|nr:hypothetical protein [Amycolatopsis sp. Hca4]QKV77832.1 hypothetical protein HUT10_31650 [Amycolatopsis sp. Hca4]